MEEIIQIDGVIRNGNFTDYLLPTFLDMPDVVQTLIEIPDPHAPLGAKGVGEPPCISSTPAIVAAIRDALRQVDGVGKPLDPRPRPPQRHLPVTPSPDSRRLSRVFAAVGYFVHPRPARNTDSGALR